MRLRTIVCLVVAAALAAAEEDTEDGEDGLPEACRAAPEKACVPKCCGEGEALRIDRRCHPGNGTFPLELGNGTVSAPAAPEDVVFIYGEPCQHGKFRLEPNVEADRHWIEPDGWLIAPGQRAEPYAPTDYCIEALDDNGNVQLYTFVCFPPLSKAEQQSAKLHNLFYTLGLLVSVPFLVATVYVYASVPELRDLHGLALCSYSACMATAYVALAAVQLGSDSFEQAACVALAYIIQFSFMACFFWLNVLCIDTFWNILAVTETIAYYPGLARWRYWDEERGWLRVPDEHIDREQDRIFARKVFFGYSFYAWGLPIILLIIVIVMDMNPAVPSSYIKPQMGEVACWFSNEQAALQYFYGPIGTILAINAVLFTITMYKVLRHSWNRKGPQRTPRQRARMCLVLFLVMGISWILEIVSWAVGGPPYVWAVTDAFNVLQGVVIFCIFVMEPRVKYLVSSKFCGSNDF